MNQSNFYNQQTDMVNSTDSHPSAKLLNTFVTSDAIEGATMHRSSASTMYEDDQSPPSYDMIVQHQHQNMIMQIPQVPIISPFTNTVKAVPDQAMTAQIMTQDEANKRGINTQVDVVGGGKVGNTSFHITKQGVETSDENLIDMPSILNFLTAHASKCGAMAHCKGTHIKHYTTLDSNGSVLKDTIHKYSKDCNHIVCVSIEIQSQQ
jgi:hypothetical protein